MLAFIMPRRCPQLDQSLLVSVHASIMIFEPSSRLLGGSTPLLSKTAKEGIHPSETLPLLLGQQGIHVPPQVCESDDLNGRWP